VNLSLNQPADEGTIPLHQLASVGPWSLSYYCYLFGTATVFELYVDGPSGDFQSLSVTSTNDAAGPTVATKGGGVGVGGGAALIGNTFVSPPNFTRLAVTVQLRTGSGPAATLSVSYVADAVDAGARRCFGNGTGIVTG
jgi:hypothetical protein